MNAPSKKTGKKITDIKPLKKKVVIYFKDEKMEILPNTFTEFNLYINKVLSEEDINRIKAFDNFAKDLNYALNLVSKYVYTSLKLKRKLLEKKISNINIDKILSYLNKHKLIDDYEFAKDYVRNLIIHHKGLVFIKEKLKALGINEEDINRAISKINMEDIYNALISYIKKLDKKYSQAKVVDKIEKIKAACIRSGFTFEEINKALANVKLAKTNYVDAIKKDYQKFKRLYDNKDKIIRALKRKGYSYSKIKSVMEEDYDLY